MLTIIVGNLIFEIMNLITNIEKGGLNGKAKTLQIPPKPTPRGLPTLKRLEELMKGVDLWEMDKPPEVVAEGRKSRRPWLASK